MFQGDGKANRVCVFQGSGKANGVCLSKEGGKAGKLCVLGGWEGMLGQWLRGEEMRLML